MGLESRYFGINVTYSLRACVWLPKQAQRHTSLLVSLVSAVTSCLYSLLKTRWTIWHRLHSQLKMYDFAENKNHRQGYPSHTVHPPKKPFRMVSGIFSSCLYVFPMCIKPNPQLVSYSHCNRPWKWHISKGTRITT